ncbi:MAG: MarR family transcriptional regulator [Intestinimonas sp.]|jgi:DNA-binding MarR family transcriptional regulator|nr:MarR family transcriptional regulator [Intestinimonas sp.]
MECYGDILMTYLRVNQHMSRLFRAHFGKLHLTFPQALALDVLEKEGPMSIRALAERTGNANSTISGVVDRLEKIELAARTRSSEDRRVTYVAVTEKYRMLRQQTETDVEGYFCSILSNLSQEEKEEVRYALIKLDLAFQSWKEKTE